MTCEECGAEPALMHVSDDDCYPLCQDCGGRSGLPLASSFFATIPTPGLGTTTTEERA